jgi:hypothetical protein
MPPVKQRNLLRRIQNVNRAVSKLENKPDLTRDEHRQLQRAYAVRGSLLSAFSSPDAGLRDLLEAHRLSSRLDSKGPPTERSETFDSTKRPIEIARTLFDGAADKKTLAARQEGYDRYVAEVAKLRKQAALSDTSALRAITDAVETEPKFPFPPWTPDAELGEALRIYARDDLLSRVFTSTNRAQLEDLVDTFRFAITSFERALKYSQSSVHTRALAHFRAWVLAHRAATFTMLYFVARTSNTGSNRYDLLDSQDDASRCLEWLFEQADSGFTRALEECPDYPWCLHFRAFLLAARGKPSDRNGPSDFFRSRRLLQNARAAQSVSDAAGETSEVPASEIDFQRGQAMLYSYDVGLTHDPDEGIEAAERSIESGLAGSTMNSDEFLSGYFAAAGQWFLANKSALSDEDKAGYKRSLQASLDAARVRARNALSQSLTVLAGLQDLQEMVGGARPDDELDYYELLKQVPPDLESRAIVALDPVSVFAADYPAIAARRLEHLNTLSNAETIRLISQFKQNYEGAHRDRI